MRHILTLISALLLCSQSFALSNYSFFVGAGSGSVNANSPHVTSTTSRTGVLFGVQMGFSLGRLLEFSPQISFVDKGAVLEGSIPIPDSVTSRLAIKYAYIEVPLFLRLKIGEGKIQVHLFGGPAYAFLGFPSAEAADGTSNLYFAEPNQSEFSLQGGAQFSYWFSQTSGLYVGGKYSAGLTKIYDKPALVMEKSSVFAGFVGLCFRENTTDYDLEPRAKEYLNKRQGTPVREENPDPPLMEAEPQ